MTTFLSDYRPVFMVVTFGFLGFAFYLTYRPRRATATGSETGLGRRQNRSRIMAFNKVMLWAVTVIAVAFLFFPQTVTDLFASSDKFTSDMDRTVIRIEGMT